MASRLDIIERFTEETLDSINDAIDLTNESPDRSKRVLRALRNDILTLTELWMGLVVKGDETL